MTRRACHTPAARAKAQRTRRRRVAAARLTGRRLRLPPTPGKHRLTPFEHRCGRVLLSLALGTF